MSAPPSAPPGEIVRVQNRETEFGKFGTRLETVTAKELGVTHDSEARADRTAETVVARNAAAKADAPPVAGKVVQAQSRKNEFGLYDNQVTTVTPVNQTTTSGEDRADQTSEVVENTQADAAVSAPPSAAAGTVARVQNRETEFGKFGTRLETVTAKTQAYSETFTRGGGNEPMTLYWGKNATALPTTANVQSASVRKNEFDRLDYNLVQVVPNASIQVRVPFEPYTVNKSLPDMVERQVINGVPYKRTYPNVFFKAAGSSNENTVMSFLEDCNYQVTFNPMANGKFFHGKGIKRGDPGAWQADGVLP